MEQMALCQWIAVGKSGREAAILAGYSEASAATTGPRVARNPASIAYIQALRAELADEDKASPANVLERYRLMGFTDSSSLLVRDGETGDWRYKRPDELTVGEKAAIKSIQIRTWKEKGKPAKKGKPAEPDRTVQTFEYTLHDQKAALDSMARVFGMNRDKVEHEHTHRIEAMFKFIAENPQTSETLARINARQQGVTIDQKKGPKQLPGPKGSA